MVNNRPVNAGDIGLIPGLGRSPGEGSGRPFHSSCLEKPMDRGAWWAVVHGVAKEPDVIQQLNNIAGKQCDNFSERQRD